jgi:hypothetical protein
MKLKDLKNNEKNPRILRGEKIEVLKRSIKEFKKMMEIRPIVIDENNVVLGGNMRLVALKKLGYKEIPDSWVKKVEGLTEDEKKEFIIKDNVQVGEWNFETLANDFDFEKIQGWGFDDFVILKEDFKPNLEPEISADDVTAEDIKAKAKILAEQMVKDFKKSIECICPKCGHEFNMEN